MDTAILLISCPDQKGITAEVTNFIYQHNGNIEHADQHIDSETNTFFMRIEWNLREFNIPQAEIAENLSGIINKFNMDADLYFRNTPLRTAVFVSRQTHCLHDLLLRHREGQFACDIPLVISNHTEPKLIASSFGIKFVHIAKNHDNKSEAENKELSLLKQEKIDVVVLARYMQIFTSNFIRNFKNKIINIHHSFLPAFAGSNPYHAAWTRGVKVIGATSHYVTDELDSGPIIEQSTTAISHRDSLADLKRKSRDLEKVVLSQALRWHLEHKILVYGNKTVIFD